MAMSRKHYVAVARAINDARTRWTMDEQSQRYVHAALDSVTATLASEFAGDNTAFSRDRFLDAAGYSNAGW